MRHALTAALCDLAERDERLVLLTGDLGFTVLEPFADRFPDRFLNVGVAEQNMIGVATGLAEAGFVPYAYSIATFATLRPYEFIRNGPLLHRLPVRIVGVGGGVDYGHNGITHYALEDVALMRVQPGMTVVVPADRRQAGGVVAAVHDLPSPVYVRLGKGGAPVPELDGTFRLGRAERLGDADGADVALVALGPAAAEAVAARDILRQQGVGAVVVVVTSFNPDPVDDVLDVLRRVPAAVTVEGHYTVGGLGSFVAEVVAEHGLDCRLARCGAREMPSGTTGSSEFLAEALGFSGGDVAQAARALLEAV